MSGVIELELYAWCYRLRSTSVHICQCTDTTPTTIRQCERCHGICCPCVTLADVRTKYVDMRSRMTTNAPWFDVDMKSILGSPCKPGARLQQRILLLELLDNFPEICCDSLINDYHNSGCGLVCSDLRCARLQSATTAYRDSRFWGDNRDGPCDYLSVSMSHYTCQCPLESIRNCPSELLDLEYCPRCCGHYTPIQSHIASIAGRVAPETCAQGRKWQLDIALSGILYERGVRQLILDYMHEHEIEYFTPLLGDIEYVNTHLLQPSLILIATRTNNVALIHEFLYHSSQLICSRVIPLVNCDVNQVRDYISCSYKNADGKTTDAYDHRYTRTGIFAADYLPPYLSPYLPSNRTYTMTLSWTGSCVTASTVSNEQVVSRKFRVCNCRGTITTSCTDLSHEILCATILIGSAELVVGTRDGKVKHLIPNIHTGRFNVLSCTQYSLPSNVHSMQLHTTRDDSAVVVQYKVFGMTTIILIRL